MTQQNPAPTPASPTSHNSAALTPKPAASNTQSPAAATLTDVLTPQGVPHDNRLSIFAERPTKDALKLQKT